MAGVCRHDMAQPAFAAGNRSVQPAAGLWHGVEHPNPSCAAGCGRLDSSAENKGSLVS